MGAVKFMCEASSLRRKARALLRQGLGTLMGMLRLPPACMPACFASMHASQHVV